MAALIARNARQTMEVQPFSYSNGDGYGTASIVQIKFGPSAGITNPTDFPKMFPGDILGDSESRTFLLANRPMDCNTNKRDRIVYADNKQYSWDARFTIGQGIGTTPPPSNAPLNAGGNPWSDFTLDDVRDWYIKYYRYYAVQITVYRNYTSVPIGAGQITLVAAKKSDGTDYDTDDPNRPLYSELVLTSQPPAEVAPGYYIRVRDDRSDWYRIEKLTYANKTWRFRLDRPYAGLNIGNNYQVSVNRNDVIATNSLIHSFTTLLGSQLEDTAVGNFSVTQY
jgi:hypothetical protein